MRNTVLSVRGLNVHFPLPPRGTVHAVDGVSFDIAQGETLGLVGESGCGKTTLGRTILGLQKATSGQVLYRDRPLTRDMRPFRRHMQMIFQDPYASLNPRMSVRTILAEPIHTLHIDGTRDVRARVQELLSLVGLNSQFAYRYPHEFSGGQRQRIGIARALAADPDFVVADEPVSALDVSIQAQILNLLKRLQDQLGLTYLFISHDLRAVQHISDRIAVMYLGEIVEIAPATELYDHPLMPYTKALISAVPLIRRAGARPKMLAKGDIPSPLNPPSGCRFHTRCPYAIPECSWNKPALQEIKAGHWAACIRISPAKPDIEAVADGHLPLQ
jgi:oligopeptide transport system ATP-binding protein